MRDSRGFSGCNGSFFGGGGRTTDTQVEKVSTSFKMVV